MKNVSPKNNNSLKFFDQLPPNFKESATDWSSFFRLSEKATREFKFDVINEIGKPLEMAVSRTDPQHGPVTFIGKFGDVSIISDHIVEVMFQVCSDILQNADEYAFDSV